MLCAVVVHYKKKTDNVLSQSILLTILSFFADGHHKLIRWKVVTHGAIDGYSRLVVFLQASNNNRVTTVYGEFLKAIHLYGLPSRIRCDQGRENISVVGHMLHHRGADRRSTLVGGSVHNQRIEHLWKDMHRCVTLLFYRLFYYLEFNDLVNPVSDSHIFALHYVFLPRINKALNEFKSYWNHHGVRTEKGMTPHQLFTEGMLRLRDSGLTAMDFFDIVEESCVVEEEGLVDEDETGVEVSPVSVQLNDGQLLELKQRLDPLAECEDYGIKFYEDTIIYLNSVYIV